MGLSAVARTEIEEQLDATDANYFVTRFACGNLNHEKSVRSLKLFTKDYSPKKLKSHFWKLAA